jgi:hypothetical protein
VDGIETSCSRAANIVNTFGGEELPPGYRTGVNTVWTGTGYQFVVLHALGDGLSARLITSGAPKGDRDQPRSIQPGNRLQSQQRAPALSPEVQKALDDCIEQLWDGGVKLISFVPSTKKQGGEATFKYGVRTYSTEKGVVDRDGVATVKNDTTSFNGFMLEQFARMAETDDGDYTGRISRPSLGLTIANRDGSTAEIKSRLEGVVYRFSPYLNYTANDREKLHSSGFVLLEKAMGRIPMTQAFELANSIGFITGRQVGDPLSIVNESGHELAHCMTMRLKNH